MVYRMIRTSSIWAAASLMVVKGKLQQHDRQAVLVATTISTIAV